MAYPHLWQKGGPIVKCRLTLLYKSFVSGQDLSKNVKPSHPIYSVFEKDKMGVLRLFSKFQN